MCPGINLFSVEKAKTTLKLNVNFFILVDQKEAGGVFRHLYYKDNIFKDSRRCLAR